VRVKSANPIRKQSTSILMPTDTTSTHSPSKWGFLSPVIVGGFASAVALWSAWFVTHLPWLKLQENVALPITLGVWAISLAVAGWSVGLRPGLGRFNDAVSTAIGAGALSAVLGLFVLGSKLTESPSHTFADGATQVAVKPRAELIALGFLLFGTLLGLIMGTLGSVIRGTRSEADGLVASRPWLARMAIVAVCATAPLLFIGGLVTSTNAGMAVPDWPNTFGSNMFLYPLGPRAQANMGENYAEIYLEHTHRLFGTLLGMAMMTLMVWTIIAYARRNASKAARNWAVGVFLGVVFQGALGGARVLFGSEIFAEDSHALRMFHGVSAQLVFAGLVVTAVLLSPAYAQLNAGDGDLVRNESDYKWKLARILANASLHILLLQLLLGAAYRHFRIEYILYTHIVLSIFVTIVAGLAGTLALGAPATAGRMARGLKIAGFALVAVVIIQFSLGWLAWLLGGKGYDPQEISQSLMRTAHQANGALLLAVATWAAVAARGLSKAARNEFTRPA